MSVAQFSHTQVSQLSSCLDLDQLCSQWTELRRSADEKAQVLSADLSHWNAYQSAVSRLMPCLSAVEQYLCSATVDSGDDSSVKTSSLTEAQQLLENHQVGSLSLLMLYTLANELFLLYFVYF